MTTENTPTNAPSSISVPTAIVVAGLIIAGSIFYTSNQKNIVVSPKEDNVAEVVEDQASIRPVDSTDHVRGNPNADLVFVEYSDLECPYCKTFHNTMLRIMDEYGKEGKVAWVYRHFPLTSIHPKATEEAMAAECAAKISGNNAYWSYIDRIFEITPSNNRFDLSQLPIIAEEIGIDPVAFNLCLENRETESIVTENFNDGMSAGVRGTPYTFVITKNGKVVPLNGALPYANVKAQIDSLLK